MATEIIGTTSAKRVAQWRVNYPTQVKDAKVNAYIESVSKVSEEADLRLIKEVFDGEEERKRTESQFSLLIREGEIAELTQLVNEYTPSYPEENWKELAQIQLSLWTDHGYDNASPADISALETLALSDGDAAIQAAVLYEHFTGENLYPSNMLPQPDGRSEALPNENKNIEKVLMEVYPSPSDQFFYVSYQLPVVADKASVNIYSVKGELIKEVDVSNGNGLLLIESVSMSNGLHLASYIVDGVQIETKEIMIVH